MVNILGILHFITDINVAKVWEKMHEHHGHTSDNVVKLMFVNKTYQQNCQISLECTVL